MTSPQHRRQRTNRLETNPIGLPALSKLAEAVAETLPTVEAVKKARDPNMFQVENSILPVDSQLQPNYAATLRTN